MRDSRICSTPSCIRVKATGVQIELHRIIADYPKGKARIPYRQALTRVWLDSDASARLTERVKALLASVRACRSK